MTALGLPVPPGFTIATTVSVDFAVAQAHPGRACERRSSAALARLEKTRRRALRRPERAAPRERPLRRARVDARHDGHDPEPRPERRDRRRARGAHREPALRVRRVPPLHRDVRRRRARRRRASTSSTRSTRRAAASRRRRASTRRASTPRSSSARSPTPIFPRSELEALVATLQGDRQEGDGQGLSRTIRASSSGGRSGPSSSPGTTSAPSSTAGCTTSPTSWGTACNVQAMVFGNLGDTSATGVAFTRDPSTGEKQLYGEWLPNAQGEDVVAGIRTPMPIRVVRAARTDDSLEAKMPEAYETLVAHRRDAREALPRHAGSRVHDPGRQALHAAVPHGEAHRRAPPCASPSRW